MTDVHRPPWPRPPAYASPLYASLTVSTPSARTLDHALRTARARVTVVDVIRPGNPPVLEPFSAFRFDDALMTCPTYREAQEWRRQCLIAAALQELGWSAWHAAEWTTGDGWPDCRSADPNDAVRIIGAPGIMYDPTDLQWLDFLFQVNSAFEATSAAMAT